MTDPILFQGFTLHGGFIIVRLEIATEPLVDALGRKALAKTRITGHELDLTVLANLSDEEWSVTLYHEILEAITVACSNPPVSVLEFNEGDFEHAGYQAHGNLVRLHLRP